MLPITWAIFVKCFYLLQILHNLVTLHGDTSVFSSSFLFETVSTAMGILICRKIFSHIPYYKMGIWGIYRYKKSICSNLKLWPLLQWQVAPKIKTFFAETFPIQFSRWSLLIKRFGRQQPFGLNLENCLLWIQSTAIAILYASDQGGPA